MPPTNSPIQHVSDTAFMVAMWRAQETERSDALFRDPLAARLAGEEGKNIIAGLPKNLFFGGWTLAIRTGVIDRFILDAVTEGFDTVLNLGAGLDARPYRLDLPADLQWIEADYPALIELKESRLVGERPRCKLERVKIDLADAAARGALLRGVVERAKRILVLTEGVTPYLEDKDVAALADDLKREPKIQGWIADYFSPAAYRYRKHKGVRRMMANAPFRFEPPDYFKFFSDRGWKPKEIRYLAEEGERLRRPIPIPAFRRWLFRFLFIFASPKRREAIRRFSGFVFFEPIR